MTDPPASGAAGPVARLLASLANALIDLGLPTIRQWLRDKVGPAADVAQVTTEGSLVHLDGIRIPVGPRGMLVLDRATVALTAVGRSSLPEAQLHSFVGLLGFGDAARWFRAEVSFTASPDSEPSAWIWGDLAIASASWTAREGSAPPSPLHGRARLFVSSREWRLDGGRLEGAVVRAHFAGGGSVEAAPLGADGEDALLVPAALSTLALSLEDARVGAFLEALSGLAGREIAVPSFVPLDAQLEGDLSWSGAEGGRAEVRVASEAIRATLRGAVGARGGDLNGRIDAYVRPHALLRGSGLLPEAMPREEDTVQIELDLGGTFRRPEVKGALRASELGFRLGRPRFVPPVVVHDLESEVFVKDDRAVVRAVTFARAGRVIVDIDANVREIGSVRGTLRGDVLEAAFLRDIARTLGVKLTIPDVVVGSVDVTLAPSEAGPALTIAASVWTAESKLVLDVSPTGRAHVTGRVTTRDIVATDLLAGAIVPTDGELTVALDVIRDAGGPGVRGTATSPRLSLALRDRPDMAPYVLEGATVDIAAGREGLSYGELRFRAHGGRFVASGEIARAHDPAKTLLDLVLEDGGAELVSALAPLVHLDLRVGADGARPSDERWVPRELAARGRLVLRGDRSVDARVTVSTPAGTALDVVVRSSDRRLDGSTLVGVLSMDDIASSGVLGGEYALSGLAALDVLIRSDAARRPVALVTARAERLAFVTPETTLVASRVSGTFRVDEKGVVWKDAILQLARGNVSTTGLYAHRDERLHVHVSVDEIAVLDLPSVSGHAPSSFVRGRSSGYLIGRIDPTQTRAVGEIELEDATFPSLDLLRPALGRYGLRPPNEDAVLPVSATVVGDDHGWSLRDVKLDLRGANVRGRLALSRERMLEGRADVTLETAYLKTSKLLTLPRVFTDRLVLPIRIGGSIERPRIDADLGAALGHFLTENKVAAFVASAAPSAQNLLRRPSGAPAADYDVPRARADLEAELREALEAYAEDWEVVERRSAERR